LTVALLGPVVNGVGTTAQAIQGIAAALDSGEPERVRNALATAPALITDRVLNGGYKMLPSSVLGEQAWPGVLTAVPLRAEPERVVTLDVNPGVSPLGVGERQSVEDPKDQDADEGTNTDVMAADGVVEAPADNGHRPRPFGSNSTSRIGGGAGLNTLRDRIRDGIHGFRDVIETVTRRGNDHDDSTAGSVNESP
jgi:hypothetical protein